MVLKTAILLAAVMLCVAARVDAQVRVTAIWKDGQSLKKTSDVTYRRKNDEWTEEGIYLDLILKPFDEINSPSGLVYIELTAPNGSIFKGWDKFALMLLPPQGKDIFINVFSGGGEMQSAVGGVMTSGEVGIVVVKTEYSVRVRHTKTGAVREFLTLGGQVEIATPSMMQFWDAGSVTWNRSPVRKVEKTTLASGQKMVITNDLLVTTPTKISAEEVAQSASVYARIDTAKAANRHEIDQEEIYQNLLKRYTLVFADPQNATKRIELAIDQVNLDVSQAALYQLQKAEQLTPLADKSTRAVIAVAKGAAFTQVGNPEAAQREFQKARTLNPTALEQDNLQRYRFNEKARQGITQFKFTAMQPGQDPGTGGAWAVPSNLDVGQQEVFKLIGQRKFAQAFKSSTTSPQLRPTSINAYADAIIFYELKDLAKANEAAAYSLKLSASDNLLPKEARDAAQRILQLTRQQ